MSPRVSSFSSSQPQDQTLLRLLQELGLSANESLLYLSALSLGPATVLQLSQASGLRRTTVYSVIEALQRRGLMVLEERGFKRLLVAENPERLQALLEVQRKTLTEALPKLSGLYNMRGADSIIKYYQGLEGIKAAYEGLLRHVRPGEDYLIIANAEDWIVLDRPFFTSFIEKRSRLSIKIRSLFQVGPFAKELKANEGRHNQHIRFLPPDTQLTTNIVIIPHHVVMHQLVPPIMAYVIENRSLVQLHRELFEIIWSATPDLPGAS